MRIKFFLVSVSVLSAVPGSDQIARDAVFLPGALFNGDDARFREVDGVIRMRRGQAVRAHP